MAAWLCTIESMLSLIAGMALLSSQAPTALTPTDDVWVYPHAGPQDDDAFMRVWGTNEYSIGTPSPGAFDFSFSLLRFKGAIPGTAKKIVLTLFHSADPAWTMEEVKKAPLELRLAPGGFREGTWEFSLAAKHLPSKDDKAILAKAEVGERLEEKPIKFTFTISDAAVVADLTSLAASSEGLNFALSTRMNSEGMGEGRTYKLFSRNAPAENAAQKPSLTWE